MHNTFTFCYVIRCTSINDPNIRSSGSKTRNRVTCSSEWIWCDLCNLKMLQHLVFSELFIWHKYNSGAWGNISLWCVKNMSKLTNLRVLVVQFRAHVFCVPNLPAIIASPHIVLPILCSIFSTTKISLSATKPVSATKISSVTVKTADSLSAIRSCKLSLLNG